MVIFDLSPEDRRLAATINHGKQRKCAGASDMPARPTQIR
jgi:hypothetical protein